MKKELTIKISTATKKVRRPGAGRTVGSFSFVKLSMRQLKKFVGDDAAVTVSRKWCESVGIVTGICAKAQKVHSTRLT